VYAHYMIELKPIMDAAKEAAYASYSPYSHFRVGAALLCSDGEIITGTNVENRSYGLTNCAERTAVFSAVSKGKKDFKALALFCPDAEAPVPPCGACRQVLSEFVSEDFPVLFAARDGVFQEVKMKDILPLDSLHGLKTGQGK
jgi:cytidine deaminase